MVNIDQLIEQFQRKLNATSIAFIRGTMDEIHWDARLIGIKGARGVGKTTLLLQYIKTRLSSNLDETLYVSLDALWFSGNSLLEMVDIFVKQGGKYLFIDEVHKYPNWSQELKNSYDDYPELKIVFTGSSLLEILNARADLSRRAIVYSMQGLSFREYLILKTSKDFRTHTLSEILNEHSSLSTEILEKVKPLAYFSDYLKTGYYPFFLEQPEVYFKRIAETINMMLEIELPLLRGMEVVHVHRIKQLLYIISQAVPFIPNVNKLSEKTLIPRSTLLSYFHYLDEIKLTKNLFKTSGGISKLQKPLKVYLENPNLMYTLTANQVNPGAVRETFFANQLQHQHDLLYTGQGDFLVDEKYIFEVGGKSKTQKQIRGIKNAFIVSDSIEYGHQNKIPLWLFGFLY